ncbi:MAG: hypothetical protein GY786_11335 [Proteobacteria bacterium]|nr:hypothetical protein [Pseudomonadota bacterium]
MAEYKEHIQIHVANADLAVERQYILRDTIKKAFEELNSSEPSKERSLLYVVNQDNTFLPHVLIANKDCDVIFTGFNVERKIKTRKKEELILDEKQNDVLQIDPTLRFPAYQEMHKLVEQGEFRLRRLILVGDINAQLRELIRLGFNIEVTLFVDQSRSKVTSPEVIDNVDQLPKLGGLPEKGQIDIANVDSVKVADIFFDGIVNMTEEGNQFFIKDDSIHDSIKKVFLLDNVKETIAQEAVEEEKLIFVRKKKVMLVLDPELKKIVSEKLKFDQMEKVFEYSSKEEALEGLETGKTVGVIEYLETEGYGILNDILNTHDKDSVLIAILGKRLLPEYLNKEFQIQGSNLKLLPKDKIKELFNLFPEQFIDRLLKRLQEKNFESFLSRIPAKIREPITKDFLKDKNNAAKCLKIFKGEEKGKLLSENSKDILATLNLMDSALFAVKFPEVKFSEKYASSELYHDLDSEEVQKYLTIFRNDVAKIRMNQKAFEEKFDNKGELDKIVGYYISHHVDQFYDSLSALQKKSIWSIVGHSGVEMILKSMHFLDKQSIMENSQEHMLQFVIKERAYIINMAKRGKGFELGGKFLLALKQFNRAESKTALYNKLVQNKKNQAYRIEGLTLFLQSPEGNSVYTQLVDSIDAINSGFDSLICVSADREDLMAHESMANATVTIVDDLVDSSLLDMFSSGKVEAVDYEKNAREIEDKISALKIKIERKGMDDPVGGYLLESMVVLMNMASKAVQNELDENMIDELDEREKIREHVIEGMKSNIVKLHKNIKKNGELLPQISKREGEHRLSLEDIRGKMSAKMAVLQKNVKSFEKLKDQAKKLKGNKRKVAVMQRDLSLKFFKLIQPVILAEVRSWPKFIELPLLAIRNRFFPSESMRRRIIIKFTDEQIRKILKMEIAFASDNEQLKQFIFTCLRIDKLDNKLFIITDSENLSDDLDLLFVGTDISDYDFSEIIHEDSIHHFSDQSFYDNLTRNEKLKKKTKDGITNNEKNTKKLKKYIEKEGGVLKKMNLGKIKEEKICKSLAATAVETKHNIKGDEKTLSFLSAEKETMDEKFGAIDEKFQNARLSIKDALKENSSAVDSIAQETSGISGDLSEVLMGISKEMAGMMFIKNVKDAVEKISKNTQVSIVKKMDSLSRFKGGIAGIKSLVVANDGSIDSTNLKNALNGACSEYFEIDEREILNMTLERMESNIIEEGKEYSMILIISDDQKEKLKTQRQLVKRIRSKTPNTHLILFSPYNTKNSADLGDIIDNMNSIRDNCLLVNTSIIDYTNKNRLLKFLNETVPA